MCGILFSTSEKISQNQFINALSKMEHRGPDVPLCSYTQENVRMGHNRLRIIGLDKRSDQPFFSQDRRYVIVYNGEIYNYRELAKQYGIPLKTNCDTELILELSIKIGFKQALQQFNGIFAYVILNTVTKEFFAARDRLGVKPLYWCDYGDGQIFASEVSAILSLFSRVELDETGLRQYRKLRTFFNGHTIYKGIYMFPPASCYNHNRLERYWSLEFEEQEPPCDEELRELVVSAVRCRQVSDVPIGSYLSGGLDSTIVSAVAGELHTWTVGFPDQNEFQYSKLASEQLGTNHHEVVIRQEDFMPTAIEMIKSRWEPLSVPNEVLLYWLTREVKKYNTVILSGEGADELFYGYDRIFRWANRVSNFDIRQFSELYAYGNNDDLEIVESVIEPFLAYRKPIHIVASFFQIAHLHGLLRRLDNATMMCSVEARAPFTDYRLVERLAGCPYEWKMNKNQVKAPLKRIFGDIVPKTIISRKKVGFPVPDVNYDNWLTFNMQTLKSELEITNG